MFFAGDRSHRANVNARSVVMSEFCGRIHNVTFSQQYRFSCWALASRMAARCKPPKLNVEILKKCGNLSGDREDVHPVLSRAGASCSVAYEASDCGLLSPDLAARICRVKGARRLGVRLGNWPTAEEGRRLIGTFGVFDTEGAEEPRLIAVLIGCGLRTAEAAVLKHRAGSRAVRDPALIPTAQADSQGTSSVLNGEEVESELGCLSP